MADARAPPYCTTTKKEKNLSILSHLIRWQSKAMSSKPKYCPISYLLTSLCFSSQFERTSLSLSHSLSLVLTFFGDEVTSCSIHARILLHFFSSSALVNHRRERERKIFLSRSVCNTWTNFTVKNIFPKNNRREMKLWLRQEFREREARGIKRKPVELS